MAALAADSVARTLQFSPAADATPPHLRGELLQAVQQRLDFATAAPLGRPASAGRSAHSANGSATAASGLSPSPSASSQQQAQQGFYFRVPSDDEDDIYDDVDSFLPTPGGHFFDQPAWQQQPQPQQDGEGVDGGGSSSSFLGASQPSAVEAVLWAHTQQLHAAALRDADSRKQVLHTQLNEVEAQLAAQLLDVQCQLEAKRAAAAAADDVAQLQRSEERQAKLQELQQQQAALQQAHATALQEAARKQQAAAEAQRKAVEAEAAAAAAAAAAKQRQQQEEQQRQQQQQAAHAQAAARAAEEARAKAATAAAGSAVAAAAPPAAASISAANATGSPDGTLIATPGALEYEAQLAAKLAAAEAAAAALAADPALKPQRRKVEKSITMWVSQISGTQQQVQDKSRQLVQLIQSCGTDAEQALACLTLANRVLSQIEVQVVRLGTFAFPLAYVCVAVGAAVPRFMELLLAKMQQACPLLVPKHTRYRPGSDKGAYLKALGYKVVDDPKTGEKRLETHDEYVGRMGAMVLLYASIVQTEAGGNPAGLPHGWTWLARCLNSLPPTRPSAAALVSFLSHAGYRMAAVYGRQFSKLLQHMVAHFLPALEAKAVSNPDLRAVGTRLHAYVANHAYREEPEGRTLKKVDDSQFVRA